KADEANTDEKGRDLDVMTDIVAEAVDQEADADHLAMFECMREPEEGRCRHAPGDEIIACRNIDAKRPAARQQHHQHKNRNQEKPGEITGEKVEPIKKHADHTVSFPSHAYCCASNSGATSDRRPLQEGVYQSSPWAIAVYRNQSPEGRVSELLR